MEKLKIVVVIKIDKLSMMNPSFIERMHNVLRQVPLFGEQLTETPFGGRVIVFYGDFLQPASVPTGAVAVQHIGSVICLFKHDKAEAYGHRQRREKVVRKR